MNRTAFTATLTGLALLAVLPARAEQFAVRIGSAFDGATPGLLATLKITEIDIFTLGGDHYLILDAPAAAYVEAYVQAIGRDAVELNALDADWTHPGVAEMPLDKRLRFLRKLSCDYCVT
ncbi:hypothetical protein [Oceanibium sediminis]|uniref:hypothetical protein n=1 Tax=Oceanibium sediminis TaxID=2026339 RepID=UPI000DD2ECBC|nr:hypothetical protein [Oceanibium sediminis]